MEKSSKEEKGKSPSVGAAVTALLIIVLFVLSVFWSVRWILREVECGRDCDIYKVLECESGAVWCSDGSRRWRKP